MGDLSKNFSYSEFACSCGCGLDNIDPRQSVLAEIIRHYAGDNSLVPNSGCRCVANNERIQKELNPAYAPFSSKSKHLPYNDDDEVDELLGESSATDYSSNNPKALYLYLNSLFPNTYGIGLYSWGVHIDVRQTRVRW